MSDLPVGAIRLRDVSRSYKLVLERNHTLKETMLRRRRVQANVVPALKNVDLDIAPGTSLGVIGKNGAGKSTLLKLIAEILPPDGGTVESGGRVVSLLELGAGFHPDFSGRENVVLNASIYGIRRKEIEARMEDIIEFAELRDFIDAPVRTYSSGMYARLGFAVASHLDPDILLLDEVMAVGDAAFQNKCMSRIAEFRREGVTIVFVSHSSAAVELACDRAIWLSGGHIAADGDVPSVLNEYHRKMVSDSKEGEAVVEATEWHLAHVTRVRCLAEGHVSDRFICREPFELDIDFDVVQETSVVVGFLITTVDGTQVAGADSRADLTAGSMPVGTYSTRVRIPRLPLLDGRFSVDIELATVAGDRLHHLERAVEFTVFPDDRGIGPVALDTEWSTQEAARTEEDAGDRVHESA